MSRRLRRSARLAGPPVVLTNVLSLQGNPYLELWNQAVRGSGAQLRELTWAGLAGRLPVDWVHLQWPERALRATGPRRAVQVGLDLLAKTAVARLRGARVLLTAHNVHTHEPRHLRLDRALWAVLPHLVTDVHLLTQAGGAEFFAGHPRLQRRSAHVIPHGDYQPLVSRQPKDVARAQAGLPAGGRLLLTFGALRAYKGVEGLLDAFAATSCPEDQLVIAGRVLDPALAERLALASDADPRVTLRTDFLPQEQLATLISAADRVVLPYRKVLNSGSVLLALSLARPVVVPDTPTFTEIGERVGPGWVTLVPQDEPGPWLSSGVDPHVGPDLSWCSWTVVSELLEELWRSSRADRGRALQ